jgi:phosphoribosylformimino-5-aminoimidazole carboxamide ribotide isomerase
MLSGPNVEAIVEMAKATNKQVIASGGVSSLKDLETLFEYESVGVAGVIVGKVLYTNQFSLIEALKVGNPS